MTTRREGAVGGEMIEFERPALLILLVPVGALAVLAWRACRRAAALSSLAGPLARAFRAQNIGRSALRTLALALAAVAAAGPILTTAEGPPVGRAAVVFVLDVSASMLARDVEPDRLTAGKDAVRRMAALLPGDGVGLVAAAGAHAVACPVTTDEGAFLLLLERLDAAWMSETGTQLRPALEEAGAMLERVGAPAGAIVVVSDGEDHGPDLNPVARKLLKQGFVVHGVCVGGATPTPANRRDWTGRTRPLLDDEGRPVLTRARPESVRRWVDEGRGRLWRVTSTAVRLPAARRDIVTGTAPLPLGGATGSLSITVHLALLAAVLLALDALLGLLPAGRQ